MEIVLPACLPACFLGILYVLCSLMHTNGYRIRQGFVELCVDLGQRTGRPFFGISSPDEILSRVAEGFLQTQCGLSDMFWSPSYVVRLCFDVVLVLFCLIKWCTSGTLLSFAT
jgi:hypothetical protein